MRQLLALILKGPSLMRYLPNDTILGSGQGEFSLRIKTKKIGKKLVVLQSRHNA